MGFPIRGIRKYVATMVATYFLMPLIGKPIRSVESKSQLQPTSDLFPYTTLFVSYWKVRIGNGFSNQGHQEVRRHHGGDVLPDAPDWKTHSRSSLSNKIRRESCRERGQR